MSSAVVKAFGTYELWFSAAQGADAREFKSDQSSRWLRLLSHLDQYNRATSNDVQFSQELRVLMEHINGFFDQLISIDRSESGDWIVTSKISLLPSGDDLDKLFQLNVNQLNGAALFEATYGLGQIAGVEQSIRSFKAIGNGFNAALQMRYVSEKAAASTGVIDNAKQVIKEAKFSLSNFTNDVKKLQSDQKERSAEHKKEMESFSTQRNEALTNFKESSDKKVDAFLNAQRELNKIQKPVELWNKAATRHRREFWAGLVALLAAVFLAACGIVTYINPALENLGFVKDSAAKPFTPASTLTLAVIVALIAAAGFVLKISGRFVTNALTLAEDAQVRAALADTFLGLTAEETKATDEARNQARTVMLAALFRPLPGHQQEDITAPTVLSLAQDLLKKPSS